MTDPELLREAEFTGRVDLRVWRRLLRFAWPYRRYALGVGLVGLGIAGAEASYTLLVRAVVDRAARGPEGASLWLYAAAYAGLGLWFFVGVWTFIRLAGKVSTHVSHDIRRAGFAKLQELSFSYYDRHAVGWLMSRLTSDCDRLSRLIGWGMLDMIWGTIFVTGIAAVMLWLNVRVAAAVLLIVPALVVASALFQRRLLAANRGARRVGSRITAAYNEALMGVRTTKTLVREEANLEEFRGQTDELYGYSVRGAMLSAAYLPVVLVIGSAASGVALWLGGRQAILGDMSPGTLVAFVMYAGTFVWPIREMARVLTDFQAAQAAAERVQGLLDTEPEIRDSPAVIDAIAEAARSDLDEGVAEDGLPERIEAMEMRHVGFQYKEGKRVLDGFDLTVRRGQTIALVGPTGGGKTTVVSLLCRFYEPTEGEVLIDGVDYRQRSLRWYQGQMGVVLQAPHLFMGTIRENIRYGRLDATDDEVERAARLACAHPFIEAMAEGYDSPVGQGGSNLSTGQKQLVALARAVLADPQIFIMDEATSSVDTETERAIQQGIEAVLRGRISFVIAHRLSTIRRADRILVIERGRIIEDGTHAALLRLRGHYYELYTNQFTREREEEAFEGAG